MSALRSARFDLVMRRSSPQADDGDAAADGRAASDAEAERHAEADASAQEDAEREAGDGVTERDAATDRDAGAAVERGAEHAAVAEIDFGIGTESDDTNGMILQLNTGAINEQVVHLLAL